MGWRILMGCVIGGFLLTLITVCLVLYIGSEDGQAFLRRLYHFRRRRLLRQMMPLVIDGSYRYTFGELLEEISAIGSSWGLSYDELYTLTQHFYETLPNTTCMTVSIRC